MSASQSADWIRYSYDSCLSWVALTEGSEYAKQRLSCSSEAHRGVPETESAPQIVLAN